MRLLISPLFWQFYYSVLRNSALSRNGNAVSFKWQVKKAKKKNKEKRKDKKKLFDSKIFKIFNLLIHSLKWTNQYFQTLLIIKYGRIIIHHS